MAPEPNLDPGFISFDGRNARVQGTGPVPEVARWLRGVDRSDVGIVTLLTEDLTAVVDMLQNHSGYRTGQQPGGWQTFHATVAAGGRDLRVVATQVLDRGPRPAAVAVGRLQVAFGVSLVLLVGTARGVHPEVEIGDVVIADQIVAGGDDAGPEAMGGWTRPVPEPVRLRVDEFFRRYRGLVAAPDGDVVRVFRGPVGTGGTAVTDVLAVESAVGGVGRAFYEQLDHDPAVRGWLTIRGISDCVDARKGPHRYQHAADNAALVADRLLPLLSPAEPA